MYSSVLVYALPNGGASAMVWGVCVASWYLLESGDTEVKLFQWLVAPLFILCVGLAMAEGALLQGNLNCFLTSDVHSSTTGRTLSPHLAGEICSAGSLGVRFSLLLGLPA